MSIDIMNNGPGGLLMVVPVASTAYGLRSYIELEPGESGLRRTSHARCDQVRVVSTSRLAGHLGVVPPDRMSHVDKALRFVFDL